MKKEKLSVKPKRKIAVHYNSHVVGKFEADLIVEDRVVVELKAIRGLDTVHEVQLVNYLKATGMQVGLLINFAPSKVDVRRKVRDRPDSECMEQQDDNTS